MIDSNPIGRFVLSMAVALILAACSSEGGATKEIDATNAVTLGASITAISEEMSEAERKEFGQSLLTIYSGTRRGLAQIDMFPDNYSRAFSDGDMFRTLSLDATELIDGKRPAELASIASDLRRKSVLGRAEAALSELDDELLIVGNMNVCLGALISAAEARGETGKVAAFSQNPTDPLHLRNLRNRFDKCEKYLGEIKRVEAEVSEARNLAKEHDYAVELDEGLIEKFSYPSRRARRGDAQYCRNGMFETMYEKACSTSFTASATQERDDSNDLGSAVAPVQANMGSASSANSDPQIQLTGWDASRTDIQRTNSGLQYVVNAEGPSGGQMPSEQDRVEVMYEGRLADGTVFDSSYARGSTSAFRVNQVISGWTEGLQLMSEGDEFVFYIPSELGYGQNPRPGSAIKPGDDLIFRVELRKVVKAPEPRSVDVEAWATYMPWDSSREDVQKTASGLEYVVLADGKEGGLTPKPTDKVVVYYEGRLANTDEVFDSAYQRGEAATFPANGLIPGWVEALSMMKPGARWLVYIPSNLAYGKEGGGSIPPNADLVFEVELLEVL